MQAYDIATRRAEFVPTIWMTTTCLYRALFDYIAVNVVSVVSVVSAASTWSRTPSRRSSSTCCFAVATPIAHIAKSRKYIDVDSSSTCLAERPWSAHRQVAQGIEPATSITETHRT